MPSWKTSGVSGRALQWLEERRGGHQFREREYGRRVLLENGEGRSHVSQMQSGRIQKRHRLYRQSRDFHR